MKIGTNTVEIIFVTLAQVNINLHECFDIANGAHQQKMDFYISTINEFTT